MTKGSCAACGSTDFERRHVLWPELAAAWELGPEEVGYVDHQQGTRCRACGNNLRAIGLAASMASYLGRDEPLSAICTSEPGLRVLEINTAGYLTQFLEKLPGHRLVAFPEFDMQALELPDGAFDLVLHSDSLEHVPDPVKGLSECRRVLRPGGACIFTVPVIVGRLSRSRRGLPASFHGAPGTETEDQRVHTEFGADAWTYALRAGFGSCELRALDYPAAITLTARNSAP